MKSRVFFPKYGIFLTTIDVFCKFNFKFKNIPEIVRLKYVKILDCCFFFLMLSLHFLFANFRISSYITLKSILINSVQMANKRKLLTLTDKSRMTRVICWGRFPLAPNTRKKFNIFQMHNETCLPNILCYFDGIEYTYTIRWTAGFRSRLPRRNYNSRWTYCSADEANIIDIFVEKIGSLRKRSRLPR